MAWHITIDDIGWLAPIWVRPDMTIEHAYEIMRQAGSEGALVETGQDDPGVIGYHDLRELVMRGDVNLSDPVGEYASHCPFRTTPASEVHRTLKRMRGYSVFVVPVWQGNEILGMCTFTSVSKAVRNALRIRKRSMGGTRLRDDPVFRKAGQRRAG
ncbi:MAG: hypothetical protein P4L33_19740 [Capsulimonadaceae bacterium]|nr:hypothetical protein [Capsulimonadaceae bacterium]